VCGACANNVAFDKATGPDGKIKGALPVELAENQGKAKGIVTYPGGDRIDWKMIQLPEGQKGKLELQMTYSTPRPGLRITFDVFDQWNTPVKEAAVSGKGKIKSATVSKAAGKYFIRIYASRRGDAAQYKLTAEFHPEIELPGFNPLNVTVADPPKLAEIPEPVSTCQVFDPNDPVCGIKCPPGAPVDWKGCPKPVTPPPPGTGLVEPPLPPKPPEKPIVARVLKADISGDGLDVIVGGGSEQGVAKAWKVTVLRGDSGKPLSGGSGTVVRVNKTTTTIHVKLTMDQMNANSNVQLSP
jgi:hypothetical protein